MWRHLLGAVLCAAALSAVPSSARAQEKPAASADSERLADQAFEAYKKGAYADAIALYTRAYQTSPDGAIIFNIARIYDTKVNDAGLAIEYYRRYLFLSDADPELVKRANERILALKAQADAQQSVQKATSKAPPGSPAAASTTPPPAAPESGGREKSPTVRAAGLVVGGVGLASIAAGVVTGLVAMQKNNDAGKLCNGNACTSANALTLTQDARTFGNVSTGTFVAGGALLAVGAALFLFAPAVGPAGPAKTGTIAQLLDRKTAGLSFTLGW